MYPVKSNSASVRCSEVHWASHFVDHGYTTPIGKMGANQSAEAPKEQVISAPDQSTSVQVSHFMRKLPGIT
jgi:hypothetical protein